MMPEPRFPCPVCRKPIVRWVLKRRLTCPNCEARLQSNIAQSTQLSSVAVAAIFCGSLLLLRWIEGDWGRALSWYEGLLLVCAAFFAIGLRWATRLWPER